MFIHNRNESYLTFAFPTVAGTHLTTWVSDYVVRQFTRPTAVTHPTTNRAQCRATELIETNVLPLH